MNEYHLQSLWEILTYMLEQTQIRGRVWSENVESLVWIRTEGIYCSSQTSLVDFCIVLWDLFSDVLDVRVQRGAKLPTDHHLLVCSFRNHGQTGNLTGRLWLTGSNGRLRKTKKLGNSLHPVYHASWDNFLMYPRTSRRKGCCSDQRSFHQLLKVVGENGLEWRAIVRKEHLGGAKRLKKLFEERKMRSRLCYRTGRHLICNPGTLRREKRQLQQWRNPRSHGKSLVVGLIPTIFRQAKCFGRPSAVYVAKDRGSRTPSRILQVTF